MINPGDANVSIVRQCALLSISRSGFYYEPRGESAEALVLMRIMDEAFLECPFYGSRQMMRHLRRQGYEVGRKRVARLMELMGLITIYQKPNTSKPAFQNTIYPYLLRGLEIIRPNHVWCTDITYIPMRKGFLYLVAIMDWYSRKILSWRVSNSMEVDFCIDALKEALTNNKRPDIFNTDQGSQFTSPSFTSILQDAGVRISMDGKGRWIDNVFIERLWRSLKYECVYLHAFETASELRRGLTRWIDFYNTRRPHSALDAHTPYEVYHQIALQRSPGHAPETVAGRSQAA
jgi:putative transposase